MAKAKKTTAASSEQKKSSASAKPKAAAKHRAPVKHHAHAKSKAATHPQAPAAPLIDTSLAAATAARMIAARNAQSPSPAAAPPETPHESAAFKQLKEGLAKSTPALGGNLAPLAGQGKSTCRIHLPSKSAEAKPSAPT